MNRDAPTTARPYEAEPGTEFRAGLERRVTAHAEREHEVRTAPDEVVHRRVDGRTVIARRLLARRTTT